MLKIKLVRLGKKKQPFYRIVVAIDRDKLNGRYMELLGYYKPLEKPHFVKLDKKRYDYWLEKGAQPTTQVRNLAKKYK